MSIFFDSSTLISFAVTCSLPMLRRLKDSYDEDFLITTSVYNETIKRALESLRFRYEAYRVLELIEDGVIKKYSDEQLTGQINELMGNMNKTYFADGRPITIMHLGETSTIAACVKENANTIAVDERTTALLIENPDSLKQWLEKKFHSKININKASMDKWSYLADKLTPLRSTEFAFTAWQKGIFGGNKDILFGLLWALKFAGCAISESEIDYYVKKA